LERDFKKEQRMRFFELTPGEKKKILRKHRKKREKREKKGKKGQKKMINTLETLKLK